MQIGKVKKNMIHSMEEAYKLVYGKISDDDFKSYKKEAAWFSETVNNNTTKGD